MSDYQRRLDRLEQGIRPTLPQSIVVAIVDYDERGICESVTMRGSRFELRASETKAALCERANQSLGPFDDVIFCQIIAAKNGAPVPGFERFAGAASTAGRTDPGLEAVGTIQRADDDGR